MNIKPLLLTFVYCLSATLPCAYGQDAAVNVSPKRPHDYKNCFHLISNSYQCGWIYYGIKGTMEGTVVAHNSITDTISGIPTACVCMVKAGKDTVRVLHLSAAKYKTGDRIKVVPAQEPAMDVRVHFDRAFLASEEDNGNLPQCRINEYDSRILKTAWGTIVRQTNSLPKKPAAVKKPVIAKS